MQKELGQNSQCFQEQWQNKKTKDKKRAYEQVNLPCHKRNCEKKFIIIRKQPN